MFGAKYIHMVHNIATCYVPHKIAVWQIQYGCMVHAAWLYVTYKATGTNVISGLHCIIIDSTLASAVHFKGNHIILTILHAFAVLPYCLIKYKFYENGFHNDKTSEVPLRMQKNQHMCDL